MRWRIDIAYALSHTIFTPCTQTAERRERVQTTSRVKISQAQLKAALMLWEEKARAGGTRSEKEARALSTEQVADEGAEYLFRVLKEVAA